MKCFTFCFFSLSLKPAIFQAQLSPSWLAVFQGFDSRVQLVAAAVGSGVQGMWRPELSC